MYLSWKAQWRPDRQHGNGYTILYVVFHGKVWASSSTLSWSLRRAVTVWHGGPWGEEALVAGPKPQG